MVKDRQKDFQFLFLMKEPDSYVFTDEYNHSKILTRETITKAVNLLTRRVSEEILSKLANPILLVIVFELDILHSYDKIFNTFNTY